MILSLDFLNRVREQHKPNSPWTWSPLTSVSGVHSGRVELTPTNRWVVFNLALLNASEGIRYVRGVVTFVEAGLIQVTARIDGHNVFASPADASMWVVDPLAEGWVPLIHWDVGCISKWRALEMRFELRTEKPAVMDIFLLSERVDERQCQ